MTGRDIGLGMFYGTCAVAGWVLSAYLTTGHALPTNTVTTSPACQHAAAEAAAVIRHHRPYQPLIDRLTSPYKARYAHTPLEIPDWLPAFDPRMPDLTACEVQR